MQIVTRSRFRTIAGYVAVVVATACVVVIICWSNDEKPDNPMSVGQLLDQMVVESEEERLALQLILTGDPDKVGRGRVILEEAALRGRPTAQRHLATYWALTESTDRRARVYQWLLVALACARGIDHQVGAQTKINYILFLTNISLIEHSTSDRDKELGRQWAKSWLGANAHAPGLAMCDVVTIDDYLGD